MPPQPPPASLLAILYQIRASVATANVTSGVSEKLASAAYLDKRLGQLAQLVENEQERFCYYITDESDELKQISLLEKQKDSINRYYDVYVHKNGVSDFDKESHEFALKRMKNVLGAHIL